MIDGKEGTKYSEVSMLEASADGKSLAFEAKNGKRHFMVVNGKPLKSYGYVGSFIFHPDGRQYAYLAGKDILDSFMVMNDREMKEYPSSSTPHFSPDGSLLAYSAENKAAKKNFYIVAGQKQKEYDSVERIYFSPDSKNFAYPAKEGDKAFMVVNQRESQTYDAIPWEGDVLFSPDGKYIGYLARQKNQIWWVVQEI